MYSTTSISPPYSIATTILCRLFGKLDNTNFSPEWILLIDAAVNTKIMNLAQILFDNLEKSILEYKRKRSPSLRVYPPFFMSALIMDTIYFSFKFPIMGWKWSTYDLLPIHVYHNILWECQFHPHCYKICQGVMLPNHKQVYNQPSLGFQKKPK